MKEDYSLEKLIETFAKHHEKVEQDRKELDRKIASGEVEFQYFIGFASYLQGN